VAARVGWPQWKVAQRYNTVHPGARLSDHRVSEYEIWPHGGNPPSVRYLARLAATYGHGCTPSQVVDADDLEHFTPADRCLLTSSPSGSSPVVIAPGVSRSAIRTTVSDRGDPDRVSRYRGGDTVSIRGSRRIVRCDARGLPIREEVIVASEESAQFRRWSAATNVDDDVLDLRAFVRYAQSNIAYWEGRYDEAAALVESALPDATSGTALLRLASQQARIHAARRQPSEVDRALALAATAPTELTPDEPGTFGFDTGNAAYYASEAHCALGGTDHLDAAVDWANTAVDEFTAESQPKISYVVAARFVLASAHLA